MCRILHYHLCMDVRTSTGIKSALYAPMVSNVLQCSFFPGKVSTGVSSLSDVEMAAAIQAWRSSVEGREMIMGQTFPISVDELFTQLFTNSKFYIDFHTSRKSFGKLKRQPISKFTRVVGKVGQ